MRILVLAGCLAIMCGEAFAQGAYNPSTNLPFLTLTAPGLSLNPAFSLTQNVAGSTTAHVFLNPSIINIGAASLSGHNIWGQGTRCNVNSASYSAELLCGYQDLFVTAIGTPGFPNDVYVSSLTRAVAQPGADSADNDASLTAGNDNIAMYANGWQWVVGREIDITVDAAVATANKIGLNIVQGPTDILAGTTIDAGIRFADNVGAVGWKNLIYLDANTHPPLASTGSIINTVGAQTFANGINISGATITNNAWASPGCIINGTGSLSCQNYTGGAIQGTNFLVSNSGSAYYNATDTGAGTDLKTWQNGSQGGVEYFTAVNDANSSVNIWMQVNRTGFVPNLVTITPPLTVTGDVKTPAHLLNNSSVPTISTCGTSPPAATAGSSNAAGQFTIGTGGTVTACTVTFAVAYPTTAFCTVSPVSSTITSVRVSSQSKTAFTITFAPATTSQVFQYTCGGN